MGSILIFKIPKFWRFKIISVKDRFWKCYNNCVEVIWYQWLRLFNQVERVRPGSRVLFNFSCSTNCSEPYLLYILYLTSLYDFCALFLLLHFYHFLYVTSSINPRDVVHSMVYSDFGGFSSTHYFLY